MMVVAMMNAARVSGVMLNVAMMDAVMFDVAMVKMTNACGLRSAVKSKQKTHQ